MKLRLAEIFTSRMVLQHGKEINIFGTGETNQQVTITTVSYTHLDVYKRQGYL